jgi:hypothetical protein
MCMLARSTAKLGHISRFRTRGVTVLVGVGEGHDEGKLGNRSSNGVPSDCGKLRVGEKMSWVHNHVKHCVDLTKQDLQVGT